MSETKWTPGPWNTGGIFNPGSANERQNVWGPRRSPEDQSGLIVAGYLRPANAHLISAAPELYEALYALKEALQYHSVVQAKEWDSLGVQVNRALAKARGEA